MNSMQIKDKLKNISVKRNIDFNTLLRLYMYDRFIERLTVSKYRDNFVLFVLMLFNKKYVEEADKRTGRVGIETQIISTTYSI
jgi:hypothetical protein